MRSLPTASAIAAGLSAFATGILVATGTALAQSSEPPAVFAPPDWGMWHQPAGSTLMANIEWFSAYTLFFMAIPVSLFVLALLAWVIYRYRQSVNPVPSKVTHNTLVEVVWTVVPVIILIAIAVPSFQLLTEYERPSEEVDLTIKATGYQWYWGYEYQDGAEGEELTFDQRPVAQAILRNDFDKNGTFDAADLVAERVAFGKTDEKLYPNLLVVDNEMVVPVGATVRLLVTAADVLHDWAMPALAAKMDAVPGRLNEFTFTPERIGLYYGQCSELCGRLHAYMPIGLRVVTPEQYAEWRRLAQTDVTAASTYIREAQDAQLIAAREGRTVVSKAKADEAVSTHDDNTKPVGAVAAAKPAN